MFGLLLIFIGAFIIAVGTLLFGIIAFNHKNNGVFITGIIFAAIGLLIGIFNLNMLFYAVQLGELLILAPIVAWIVGIVFLILSKSSSKTTNEDITDDFLNDIINSEDEEWNLKP